MDTKLTERMEVLTNEKAGAAGKTGVQPFNPVEAWWQNLDSLVTGLIIAGAIAAMMVAIVLAIGIIWRILGHS